MHRPSLTCASNSGRKFFTVVSAGVAAAEQATVLLDDPRDEARDLDETWVGTWEETYGAAEPVTAGPGNDRDTLFSEAEMTGAAG